MHTHGCAHLFTPWGQISIAKPFNNMLVDGGRKPPADTKRKRKHTKDKTVKHGHLSVNEFLILGLS